MAVGQVKITRVIEMEVAGGTKFILPQATPEEVLKMPYTSTLPTKPVN